MIAKDTLRYVVFAIFIAIGLAALPVNAQQADKSITINREGKVGDQLLAKGNYTIKFTEDKDGELVILYRRPQLGEPARLQAVAQVHVIALVQEVGVGQHRHAAVARRCRPMERLG